MIQDILRAIIQRIFRDKILMGLVIIGILAVFMTGKQGNSELGDKLADPGHPTESAQQSRIRPQDNAQARAGKTAPAKPQEQGQGQAPVAGSNATKARIDHSHAEDFVKYWVGPAFDYRVSHARASHEDAFKWMTAEAQQSFRANFWSEALAQGIETNQIIAAFHPVSIQAQAVNPDGSVVVALTGTLVMQQPQASIHPSTQNIIADFLVRQDPDCMRIAGVYNRSCQQAATYQASPPPAVYQEPQGRTTTVY